MKVPSAARLCFLILLVGVTACDRGKRGTVIARAEGKDITLARFSDFYRPPTTLDPDPDQIYQTLREKLDDLIGYILIQEAGRAEGLHKTRDFNRRLQNHEKDLLNRILKQRQIVERIVVDPAAVDTFVARSKRERRVQHILTLNAPAAADVRSRLEEGEEWESVARIYSKDPEVVLHGGDLGWIRWGEGNFSYYPDLQERVFALPVGTWEGPIETRGEYHFIKVLEERDRELGTEQEERQAARERVAALIQREMEQQFADRMWERGGYRIDEDHFRWLVEKIQESFERNPAANPVPVLAKEDRGRVVIRSPSNPYTAQELLDRLELRNPQARDNAITLGDWRKLFIEWVLTDEAAMEARRLGYHKDPGFLARRETFIDSRLYALKLEKIESARGTPTDEDVQAYYESHPEDFDIPEMRRIVEVLLATREEAEQIRKRVEAGEDLENLAYKYTIREGFKERGGRFAPIRPGEFGALGEAVFQTGQGELGPIVETPLGFSVFKVMNIVAPRLIRLDDIRDDLRARMKRDWERENLEAFKTRAWQRARIWRNEELLRWYAEQIARSIAARTQTAPDSSAAPGDTTGASQGR